MHYIILDLEWNQAMSPSERDPRLTFEVIEIGAVKLDENLKQIGEYQAVIRPVVYRHLHYRIREITRMRKEDLANGRSFSEVGREFLDWCGEDFRFCTWGSMDLTELQKNMRYFGVENTLEWPLYYYDLQKLYGLQTEGKKSAKALQTAVEELGLEQDIPFHRADADTYYTMKVMQKLDMEQLKKKISVDCYRLPRSRSEQIRLKFDTYDKFISRPFSTPEAAMSDRDVVEMTCPVCGAVLKRKVSWFAANGHNFLCAANCPLHGWVRGKARVRRHFNGRTYVVKTSRLALQSEIDELTEKQRKLREKRRQHRHVEAGRKLAAALPKKEKG